MIYALAATLIVLLASTAATMAVTNDFPLAQNDNYQKQAYAAAQAGVQRYLFELNADSEYWTQCVPSGANWIYNTADAETPAAVPGSSTEGYAVKLLPAAGQSAYTSCSTSDPVDSMIQQSGIGSGTFRIAVTGYAGSGCPATPGTCTVKRTLVANLREQSFLDYSYFTTYETTDPLLQVDAAFFANQSDTSIEPSDQCQITAPTSTTCGTNFSTAVAGASTQCSQYRYAGRYTDSKAGYGAGNFFSDSSSPYQCTQIQFAPNDSLSGPFHSNDSVLICNSPTFGRNSADQVEFGGPNPGSVAASNCSDSPNIQGTYVQSSTLTMPKTNSLSAVAANGGASYSGVTCLNLTTSGIGVYLPTGSSTNCANLPNSAYSSVNYPANGVLYVNNSSAGCSLQYDVNNPVYTGNLGCGTVYVKGTTNNQLTIGADNDIVVDGNLTYNNATAMIGLVATNFIRAYHPVASPPCNQSGESNGAGSLTNLTIDAMMLSLNKSFVVDDYACGASLQKLTVLGGIAQNYRGTVGTTYYPCGYTSCPTNTGYTKNYTYDNRLLYQEPPHFLTPVEGAWKIARQTECDVYSTASSGCEATS